MATAEQRFRAMGSDCHVLVVTPDLEGVDSASIASDIVALAAGRVELLEQSWSRFRPTSELNHLNASAGSGPVRVSPDLLLLVDRMQQAWAQSEGRFDPTVLSSMLALGYDGDLHEVAHRGRAGARVDDVVTAALGPAALEGGRRGDRRGVGSGGELQRTQHAVGVVRVHALVLDADRPRRAVGGGAGEGEVAAEVDEHAGTGHVGRAGRPRRRHREPARGRGH